MLQLGLLRVVTWSGSRFFRKRFFRLKIFGARPFSMMFFSPKFNYPDTSTHLLRGVMVVEEPIRGFLDTTATLILSFGIWPHDLFFVEKSFFDNVFQDFLLFFLTFAWLLPKRLITKFRLSGLFVFFYSSSFFWTSHGSLHCLRFVGSICDCLSPWVDEG